LKLGFFVIDGLRRNENGMSAPESFTWIDGHRLGAMARPGSPEDLVWLRKHGVQVLISLTEEPPARSWVEDAGLLLFHVPILDMDAPSQEQFERCVRAIERANANKMGVVVHCGAGLGRTGAILAAYLVAKGATPEVAISRIRALRPGSIETDEQEEAIAEFSRRSRQSTST
jgi:atypical dual specificity phosphatase